MIMPKQLIEQGKVLQMELFCQKGTILLNIKKKCVDSAGCIEIVVNAVL